VRSALYWHYLKGRCYKDEILCLICRFRTRSGKGQVIDNAMVDGVLYIGSFLYKHKLQVCIYDISLLIA